MPRPTCGIGLTGSRSAARLNRLRSHRLERPPRGTHAPRPDGRPRDRAPGPPRAVPTRAPDSTTADRGWSGAFAGTRRTGRHAPSRIEGPRSVLVQDWRWRDRRCPPCRTATGGQPPAAITREDPQAHRPTDASGEVPTTSWSRQSAATAPAISTTTTTSRNGTPGREERQATTQTVGRESPRSVPVRWTAGRHHRFT